MPPDRTGRPPTATYRLQMGGSMDFDGAASLLDYLSALGVSHLYLSPVFQARTGSAHGYDIVLPDRLSPSLGGKASFLRLARRARELGLGIVLDIVPNHLAAHEENPWWRDVLEHGPESPWAPVFDIAWKESSQQPGAGGRLVLPLLGAPYGREISRGALGPALREGVLVAAYHDRAFPLRLGTWAPFLREIAGDSGAGSSRGGAGRRLAGRLAGVLEKELAGGGEAPAGGSPAEARARESVFRILGEDPSGAEALAVLVKPSRRGGGARPEAVDALLRRQHYRLVWWRAGVAMVNYRRFFDINDLAGVRVEDPAVFDRTHALILELWREGAVDGLRIDHLDGLADPAGYLRKLREALGEAAAGEAWIVVEKILGHGEQLPSAWPVEGTTGYEFTAALNGVQVDPAGLEELGRFYREFTDDPLPPAERTYLAKRRVIHDLFQSEFIRLARRLGRLASADYRSCDLLPVELRRALVELTAALPVYRTYLQGHDLPAADRRILRGALDTARRRAPSVDPEAFGLLERLLLHHRPDPAGGNAGRARHEFVRRWQQVTGAVMAKSLEDTVLYQYPRLLSMNEVGCEPDPPQESLGTAPFHRRNARVAARRPTTMLATATHDSKRGEDCRARIHVLSEMAGEWAETARRWHVMNQPWRTEIGGAELPDSREELLIYQTLVGALPMNGRINDAFRRRIREYVIKAARESKLRTSWLSANPEHEAALERYTRAILDPRRSREFLRELRALAGRLAAPGAVNSLAHVALKICSPGVPDFYQGTEAWSLTLVDPDNRRAVDFQALQAMLDRARSGRDAAAAALRLLERWKDGAIKLFVTARGLEARRRLPDLFGRGACLALEPSGPRAAHLCAFARRRGRRWILCIVPRLTLGLLAGGRPAFGRRLWHRTAVELPAGAPGAWQNLLTGERIEADPRRGIRAAEILSPLPVAILEGPAG